MRALTTILLGVLCLAATAQTTWCPSGATWTYPYGGFIYGHNVVEYTKDTTINGQSCKQLRLRNYPQGSVTPTGTTYQYTFERNDTVFFWRFSDFYPTFYFDALVGETYLYKNDVASTHYTECDLEVTLTIDSVGTIQIGGETRKYYVARASSSTGTTAIHPSTIKVIEGIGCVGAAMQPIFSCAIGYDPVVPTLACYYDDSLGLFHRDTSFACSNIGTQVQEYGLGAVSVYPNPTLGSITVTNLHEEATLSIFALDGRQVFVETLQSGSTRLDISALLPGMYIYHFAAGEKLVIGKLVRE